MASINEQILRAAKEIVVKFVEGGRVSPSSFKESFKEVYDAVEESVRDSHKKYPEKSKK